MSATFNRTTPVFNRMENLRRSVLLALGLFLPGGAVPIGRVPAPADAPVERRVVERRVVVAPAETLSVSGGASGAKRGDVVVLLLPGPVGSAFSMRSVVRELQARGIEPFVVDPLGMGASTRPRGADYTLSAQAARIDRVLEQELPAGVSVIVAAQGTSATIAWHLAATDTARVRGVVSIAGGPIDKQGTPGVRTALTFAALLDNPIGRSFAKRRFVSALRDQSADDRWLTTDVVKQYVAPIENDLRGLLRTLGAMQAALAPQLSTILSANNGVRLFQGMGCPLSLSARSCAHAHTALSLVCFFASALLFFVRVFFCDGRR
jgi:pimeloyl-ACP methyl ester carboxylesterase